MLNAQIKQCFWVLYIKQYLGQLSGGWQKTLTLHQRDIYINSQKGMYSAFILPLDCFNITVLLHNFTKMPLFFLITCRMPVILLWSTISWAPWMRTMMGNWHFRNSGSWLANWQAHMVVSANNFTGKQFEISHWHTCRQRSSITMTPSHLALTQKSVS